MSNRVKRSFRTWEKVMTAIGQGVPVREVARQMKIPESTIRLKVKRLVEGREVTGRDLEVR